MKVLKIAYKPVGLVLGAVSGMLAGALFKQAWKAVGHDEAAPDVTGGERASGEVLAATVQGAIFAEVKTAVVRAGAAATRRLTASCPG